MLRATREWAPSAPSTMRAESWNSLPSRWQRRLTPPFRRSTATTRARSKLRPGALRLLAEELVQAHAVDCEGPRPVAAHRQGDAARRVHEGAADPVRDYRLMDAGLLQSPLADQPGAVRGDADAPVLLQQRYPEPGGGQVAGRTRTGGAGADHRDVVVVPCREASST